MTCQMFCFYFLSRISTREFKFGWMWKYALNKRRELTFEKWESGWKLLQIIILVALRPAMGLWIRREKQAINLEWIPEERPTETQSVRFPCSRPGRCSPRGDAVRLEHWVQPITTPDHSPLPTQLTININTTTYSSPSRLTQLQLTI